MKALTRVKIRLHLKALPLYIIVLICLFIIAWLTNKYVEAFCFSLSFLSLRYKFDTTYHCNTTLKCMCLTISLIFICIPIVLFVNISLFSSIFIAFVVTYGSYIVADRLIKIIDNKIKKDRILDLQDTLYINKHTFDLYKCTKEELIEECRQKGLNARDTQIAIMSFINKYKPREIMRILCENGEYLEWDSLYVIINRIKNRLTK